MLVALAAIMVVVATSSIWLYLAFQVRIPRNRKAFQVGWTLGALLGLWALFISITTLTVIIATLAVLLGALLLFLSSTSAQLPERHDLAVGQALPAFTAMDENNEPFDSQSLTGKPVLLKFFRGHW